MDKDDRTSSGKTAGDCEVLTVTSAHPEIAPRCDFCRDEIGDHFCRYNGIVFCSQDCARRAEG